MLNRDEQADRIVTAWAGRERARGVIFTDRTTAMDLAMIALTALECGESHPDRPDVRCTQPPHDQGHLYHRNSDLNVEWWTSGDGVSSTVHDVLGPIQLVQPPFTGVGETLAHRLSRMGMSGHVKVTESRGRYHTYRVPCPVCRWITQDGRDHDQLIDGWKRCAHCGHEWRGPETRPSSWCRAKHPEFDVYCDTMHHPLNTRQHGSSVYGIQWVAPETADESVPHEPRGRYHTLPPCEDDEPADAEDSDHDPDLTQASAPHCGAKHDQYDWYCDRAAHVVSPDDKWTWHNDRTKGRYWYLGEDVAVSVASGNDAHRAVYRDLLPILGTVASFLNDLGKRYREGNPRMTSATCRSAETHRDALHDTAGKLRDLLDGADS